MTLSEKKKLLLLAMVQKAEIERQIETERRGRHTGLEKRKMVIIKRMGIGAKSVGA